MSYLFEQSHGKLLVGYAVFGCADVFSALRADVEVDPHQEILLRHRREDGHQLIPRRSQLTCRVGGGGGGGGLRSSSSASCQDQNHG
ncbi:hypothetical protein EYF80_021344 [Liparis tanakae]|uniref:Uncharacterized protein n=1 Tax=Liparis tanakae TaxID=230148 RepID=A0A4Z2HTZ9_9TELE|nr:hypothetical protein EYF80_021344 [Liparis tanakae]